jgi:hypothetical protein
MAAPWAAQAQAATSRPGGPHSRVQGVHAVAPGAWGAAAAAAPPPDAATSHPKPHEGDAGDAPREAADFELLALHAATPQHAPNAPSLAERCAALRALRAGVAMAQAAGVDALSAACCAAALDATVLAWSAAAEADAAEQSGGSRLDPAATEALREWLEAAEAALQALSRWAAFAPKALPPLFASALFGRLASQRTRDDEATRLRALLHWCALQLHRA